MKRSLRDISPEEFKRALARHRRMRRPLPIPDAFVPPIRERTFTSDAERLTWDKHQADLRRNKSAQTFAQPLSSADGVFFRAADEIPGMFGLKGESRKGWRRTDRLVGEINGLPTTHGMLVATNGVLCAIRQGERIILGHNEFFVLDTPTDVDDVFDGQEKKPRRTKLSKTLEDYA